MAQAPVIREHEHAVSPDGNTEAEATATAEGGNVNIYPDRLGRSADDDCFGLSPRECAKHKERMAKIEGGNEARLAQAYGPKPSQEGKWAGLLSGNTYSPSRVEAWTNAPTLTNAPTRVDSHDRWRSNTDIRSNTDARDLSRGRNTDIRNFPSPVVVPPVVIPPIVGGGGCFVTCPRHNVCVTDDHPFHPQSGVLGAGGSSFGNQSGLLGTQSQTAFGAGRQSTFGSGRQFGAGRQTNFGQGR